MQMGQQTQWEINDKPTFHIQLNEWEYKDWSDKSYRYGIVQQGNYYFMIMEIALGHNIENPSDFFICGRRNSLSAAKSQLNKIDPTLPAKPKAKKTDLGLVARLQATYS